jgi:23S rRNA (guanine745-N1)-methyltransferase
MNALRCPLCCESLSENHQGLVCVNRHQFDRAKEGYFNLLPVQFKHSREPGDAKAQLRARRLFLEAGCYSPLKSALQDLVPRSTGSLLDLGCGEGYFTRAMAECLLDANLYGVDIAKEGIRMAAKAASGQGARGESVYMVASAFAVPLVDQSMDVITRIYAPSDDAELHRLLRPDGLLVIVTPGNQHLHNLRSAIYEQVRPHPLPQAPAGFVSHAQSEMSGSLNLSAGELTQALLTMTPFAWRMSAELASAVVVRGLEDTYHFYISCYKRVTLV